MMHNRALRVSRSAGAFLFNISRSACSSQVGAVAVVAPVTVSVRGAVLAPARQYCATASTRASTSAIGTPVALRAAWRVPTAQVASLPVAAAPRALFSTDAGTNFSAAHIIKTTETTAEHFSRESSAVLHTVLERLEADDIDLAFSNDVEFSGDVLNVRTAKGTWVLNKHNVTRQIWLSSPVSGPSKYNYHYPQPPQADGEGGRWLSERDGASPLSALLRAEFSQAFGLPVTFQHEF